MVRQNGPEGYYEGISRRRNVLQAQWMKAAGRLLKLGERKGGRGKREAHRRSKPLMQQLTKLDDRRRALDELEAHPPFEPLIRALFCARLGDVMKLCRDGKDIPKFNRMRIPLLAQPSYAGDEEIVDYLLSRGADVHLTDADGKTALALAAMGNNAGIFKKLLQAGADPRAKSASGETIRDFARKCGSEEVLEILDDRKLLASLKQGRKQNERGRVV